MDLRHLRHFVTVAEELHFGRAAEKLNMTQPPLSQSIRALEAELGMALFERSKRHVALTPVGAQWLPHARALLASAADLPVVAQRLSRGEIGSLRLAFVSTATYGMLPLVLSHYKAQFPAVEVILREATSDVQIDALLDNTIDAGLLIAPAQAMPPQISYLPLHRENLVAAIPDAFIQSGRIVPEADALGFSAIAEEPLILFPRQSAPALYDLIAGYYTAHNAVPALGQQAVQMQTIIGLVSAGLGIALVPASMRNLARAGVTYLPLAEMPPLIETGLAWHRTNDTPALRHFIATAREQADPEFRP